MGFDYALVHLYYTVPLATLLHGIYSPLMTRRDIFKFSIMMCIVVVYTSPWDSYLIHRGIWSYPEGNVLGTYWLIPIEEYFFFFIQTYITSCLYMLLSKSLIHPLLLTEDSLKVGICTGFWLAVASTVIGATMVYYGNRVLYFGLLLTWASPVLALLISLCGHYFLALPTLVTSTAILCPTLWFWLVDSFALRNGTWKIEKVTKLDWQIYGHLDIEEAIFFLLTNSMIVLGLVACDKAFAIMDVFPRAFPSSNSMPSLGIILRAVTYFPSPCELCHIKFIKRASGILRKKSKSFYLSCSTFPDRCRVPLISLYAFCRTADDLIDDAPDLHSAKDALQLIAKAIDEVYARIHSPKVVLSNTSLVFLSLQRTCPLIPQDIFTELLEGFSSDLSFLNNVENISQLPIQTEDDLITYCKRVASTVSEMFVYVMWDFEQLTTKDENCGVSQKQWILARAREMGIALQLINIARDIIEDAYNGRVYLPVSWFESSEEKRVLDALRRGEVMPSMMQIISHQALRLVKMADAFFATGTCGLPYLPKECLLGTRLAIELYMDIGRKILQRHGDVRERAVMSRSDKVWRLIKILYGRNTSKY